MPYKNDFVVLGLLCGVIGSLILVKGGIWRPDLRFEALTYLGTNPFLYKSASLQRWEGVLGFTWILLGFGLSLVGTLQAVREPSGKETLSYIQPLRLTALLALLLAFSLIGSLWLAKRVAMHQVLPQLVRLQRHLVTTATGTIQRDGLRDIYLAPGAVQPTSEVRQTDYVQALETLERIGRLFDLPRDKRESEKVYSKRLEIFVSRFSEDSAAL